jgi:hypothetical protein
LLRVQMRELRAQDDLPPATISFGINAPQKG